MAMMALRNRSKVICIVLLIGIIISLKTNGVESRKAQISDSFEYSAISCRAHSASLEDFGGVGDGITSNTKAFKAAIDHLNQFQSDGGSQLFVPLGKWLTGIFNLTSHFTLFLHKDAVLLASQDEKEWPVIEPLPYYDRGRDTGGGRYSSLIFGTNLTDVVITGDNGTIDGQGEPWWQKFHAGELNYTRPYLIEIMYSQNIQISNLTLINSPSWNVHPVYRSKHMDTSTCGALHSVGFDVTRIKGRSDIHQSGSFRSEQTISKVIVGNTPTSRAGPVASRESFVLGNEKIRTNGSINNCDEVDDIICSRSTQYKRLRKTSTVKEPILQHVKRQKSIAICV